MARLLTAAACLLVFSALIAPVQVTQLKPQAFVRIPVEGLIAIALVLILPGRARKIVAAILGVALGLVAIIKVIDIGFYATLARPFNPMLDWSFFSPALEFLSTYIGRTGAIVVEIAVVALALGVVALMSLSMLRLSTLLTRNNTTAARAVATLGAAWVACDLIGAQLVPGVPVAATTYDNLLQIRLNDNKAFAAQAAIDPFRNTPADQLLTGLRGKDVMLTFVESYGRTAIEKPEFAPKVDAVLDEGTRKLRSAGFSAKSAFLSSPTSGGGSWLAHSTLLSGLWVDNQQRYNKLVTSDRFTLTAAFRRAGWRTVAVEPGVTRAWPEASFYGYDKLYDRWTMGYQGPRFNWGMPPDQYTLAEFERAERSKPNRGPILLESALVSSHAPWAPTPSLIDWKDVGDGKVFGPMAAAGDSPEEVWRKPARVRNAYRNSIEYTLNTLVSYVQTYGDDNLVLIFLGDHQPAPIVTGGGTNRDVPITIVARDRAVLDRISGWGWHDGLNPGTRAPVWKMDTFRNKFLTAFGPDTRAPAETAR